MTPERTAMFTPEETPEGTRYWPANRNATAVCVILSRRVLPADMLLSVRSRGYTPRLTNGEEIGGVDVRA